MNQDASGHTHLGEYDVAVVGGGAAGLSAALVLTRAQRRVAVIDAGRPRNAPAAHMHGYLGSDGLAPAELLERGRREVAGYGGRLIPGTVIDVSVTDGSGGVTATTVTGALRKNAGGFRLHLEDGTALSARRVLVTTGLRDELPDIPGVRERWGRDLLHCPYCHGYEVRDQPLGVLGGSPESIAHALLVRQWSDDVVLFSDGGSLVPGDRERLVASAVGVVDAPVARLVVEDDHLTGVELVSGQVVARTAVFVRPRFVANDTLLKGLGGAVHDDGWVVVDPVGQTTVPGIWAAGNATNPRAQVITAAGEGSAAAIAVNNDLVDEDSQRAVDHHRLGSAL